MNRRMIFYMVGNIIKLEALMLILPLIVSVLYNEINCINAFSASIVAATVIGFLLTIIFDPKDNKVIYAREGFIIVTLAWIFLSVIGALPFVITQEIPNFFDAVFETVSGFTTTGASILSDVESMSRGLLFWRSFTHWLGGMGVLVLIMAIIPTDSGRAIHILRAEMAGPVVGKIVPKIKDTAKILYIIYLSLTILEMIFLLFGGIGLAWAVALAFLLKDTKPASVAGAPQKASAIEAVKAMVGKPSALLLALGFGMMIYVDIGFKTWMPDHLKTSTAFASDFKAISDRLPWLKGAPALFAVVWHYLGALVGVMVASRVSDRLVKSRPGIRMEMNILGLALAVPFIWWMAHANTLFGCCVAMALFGVFRGVYDSNLFASLFDVIKPRYHASAGGIMLCCAFIFGSSSSTVLGWMKQTFSMQTGLASLAGFYLTGALVILVARLCFLRKDYEG